MSSDWTHILLNKTKKISIEIVTVKLYLNI